MGKSFFITEMMTIIKRYPNRKLYNTERKQYVTLSEIAHLIQQGHEIQVIDHLTNEDLTSLTLTQIILEQERKQSGLLSNSFLTGLIRSGGDHLSSFQRNIRSRQNFWRQMDDEIRLRIQALIYAGELTDQQGQGLLNLMLSQGDRLNEGLHLEEHIEEFLKNRDVPTREDIRKLYNQLEELSVKLTEKINAEENDDHLTGEPKR